ncbi:MAG: glycosyl transferase group 1 [Pelosinus sp.]|jgi:glycosyltransferase involved in cell wall biosynthesis|nr:glycosyl transferase group 1 [Pelosinus sp.]
MRLAIMESITSPGGHEVDFDRIIVDECKALGHEVVFYVPEKFVFNFEYGVPIRYLSGEGISYTNMGRVKKIVSSVKREINRQRWYRQMFKYACRDQFDAIIVPTSTYRYLRAININVLKKSPIPIIFIVHGINPKEAPHFYKEVEKLKDFPNIKIVVLTFGSDVLGRTFPNVYCTKPPAYIPRDILGDCEEKGESIRSHSQTLTLGFFGQYRREKKLDAFLDAFLAGKYTQPVELLVQGATMKPEDSIDFERIIQKYQGHKHIKFLHKGLFGKEWQQAIANVDALLMPYSAARYQYHWAGMLFTAIGYQKPVVLSSEINPEVLQEYELGCAFQSGDTQSLFITIETFINTFSEKYPLYIKELARAYTTYSPSVFAERLVALCTKR